MEPGITIETVFDDGRTAEHRLSTWRRLLSICIQKVAIEAQMEEISATCRACPCCGKVRTIHDYQTRTLETLFGRMTVRGRLASVADDIERKTLRPSKVLTWPICAWENDAGCAGRPRARIGWQSQEPPRSMEGFVFHIAKMPLDPRILSTPARRRGK